MEKRKRTGTAPAYLLSDSMPCSTGSDPILAEKHSSDPNGSSILRSFSSVKEVMDSHGKQTDAQLSLGHHHYNLSRAMFLKRSCHHYGNPSSRKHSPNYSKPFTSYGKNSPFRNERSCFKLGGRSHSELGNHPEFREKALWWPERIRMSSSANNAVSPETVEMVCGICEKPLRQKPQHFESRLSSEVEELTIAAVLVCGHIYHADCLEKRTCKEDIRDPPCPVCPGSVPDA